MVENIDLGSVKQRWWISKDDEEQGSEVLKSSSYMIVSVTDLGDASGVAGQVAAVHSVDGPH